VREGAYNPPCYWIKLIRSKTASFQKRIKTKAGDY